MARSKCPRTGKDRFPSELEANLAIADIGKNSVHHRKQKYRELPTRSYRCGACRSWHMTSQEEGEESLDSGSLTG